jgi:hypothetical protein
MQAMKTRKIRSRRYSIIILLGDGAMVAKMKCSEADKMASRKWRNQIKLGSVRSAIDRRITSVLQFKDLRGEVTNG